MSLESTEAGACGTMIFWKQVGQSSFWADAGAGRLKSQIRNPRVEGSPKTEFRDLFWARISDFGFLSAFGLRLSAFRRLLMTPRVTFFAWQRTFSGVENRWQEQ